MLGGWTRHELVPALASASASAAAHQTLATPVLSPDKHITRRSPSLSRLICRPSHFARSAMSNSAIDAYRSLPDAQVHQIWDTFPSSGVLVVGNVSESAAICRAAGGGVYTDDEGVRRVTGNKSIPMYFCGTLEWKAPMNVSTAHRYIKGNYSENGQLATGPYEVVWDVVGQDVVPSTARGSRNCLGNWWWVPIVGTLAAAALA